MHQNSWLIILIVFPLVLSISVGLVMWRLGFLDQINPDNDNTDNENPNPDNDNTDNDNTDNDNTDNENPNNENPNNENPNNDNSDNENPNNENPSKSGKLDTFDKLINQGKSFKLKAIVNGVTMYLAYVSDMYNKYDKSTVKLVDLVDVLKQPDKIVIQFNMIKGDKDDLYMFTSKQFSDDETKTCKLLDPAVIGESMYIKCVDYARNYKIKISEDGNFISLQSFSIDKNAVAANIVWNQRVMLSDKPSFNFMIEFI
jgi:hypothetical protein